MMKTRGLSKKARTNILGYLLVAPMLVGFLVFGFIPLINTIYGSFFEMNGFFWSTSKEYFYGFGNYVYLFKDDAFLTAIGNTFFLMLGIPIGMVISFFIATAINSHYVKAKKPYLIIYYLPAVSSAVAIGIVWKWLFNADYGVVNNMFGLSVAWLSSPDVVKFTLIMKGVWGGIGGTLLLYYASIQNISLDMYEAADVEGANFIQKTFRITIPMVNGTTFYLLVTGIIGGIMAFADNYVVVSSKACNTIMYYLFDKMQHGEYGLVTAGSIIVFLLLFTFTLIQFLLYAQGRKGAKR